MGDAPASAPAPASASDLRPGAAHPPKKVFFFDIDNCLYPKSAKVHDRMAELIDRYFVNHLALPWDEAVRLHKEYYQSYGLAIEGLVRHHQIDPLEYNKQVDDALPLEGVIVPNPQLKQLLQDLDRREVRLWLFTNAYVTHGRRVVRLLEVADQFDGITYCDYSTTPLVCKPHKAMFAKAMREAGVDDAADCYFVDDSYINCKSAQELGWTAVHLVEDGVTPPPTPASQYQIRHLDDLRQVFPQFFKREAS
ncbi:pyrimidine nucleotidase [Niveomyces insectorum RCEF 264]|uniref:Pyrimidine nucleotidase n=1 Tax=Niveomyces insectorum RCEF 264 TaxID=1081102 RepID=A0A167PHR9_9HYPO|nr:pyrimidine nucleotidase [Niveomyces insectorum RCEF 264]